MPRRRAEEGGQSRARRGAWAGVERRLLGLVLKQMRLPPLLDPPPFPEPASATPEGLLGFSPSLEPDQVVAAYRQSIFPMADPSGLFGWWSPDPRAVLDLERVHFPRRLLRTARSGRFETRVDAACADVIAACAAREETWISPRLAEVYLELHRRGVVHSVETWRQGRLVGGLYGLSLGGAFMAESMFHRETDAGKVAVVALIERLRARGYSLLDIQQQTGATAVFEPALLERGEYLRRLRVALQLSCRFEAA